MNLNSIMKNVNKNKFLHWVLYISLAIIPFLAFYVSGFGINATWDSMLFPYIAGKNFGFRILVEIAAAAWVMLMILDKNFRPKKSVLLYVYSIFVFVLLLADIFSVNPVRSFLSNYERMEGFISHAHLFLYFLMLITLFKDKASWVKYKSVLFISNIPVILLAILQLIGLPSFGPMKYLPALRDAIHNVFAPSQGGLQLDSSLGNSTYLAIYSVFFIFLFFIRFLEARSEKAKNHWVYILMAILNLIVLFYTQTRGAQVGFAVGIFITAIILYFGGRKYKELKNKRKIALAIILITLVSFISLISFNDSNFIKNSSTLNKLAKVSSFANPVTFFSKISDLKKELYDPSSTYQSLLSISGDGTFTSRLLNIKMSLEGFKERPILGWGQDNYFYVFAKHNDARMYAQEPWFDRTHNVFMDWLIAGGIIGLLAYLGLYFAALWMMWWSKFSRNHKDSQSDFIEKSLLTGLIVAYFIHNIFVFDNLVSYILFFVLLAYISIRFNSPSDNKIQNNNVQDEKGKIIIYGPIVLLALLASLYFLNVRYINANKYIIKGLMPEVKQGESPVEALSRSLNYFKKASEIGGIAKMESREQLAQNTISLLNQIRSANIPQTEEYLPVYKLVSDYISTTKNIYSQIVDIKNPDPRSLAIYSTFLRNVNESTESLKYGEMAYKLAPMKQTVVSEYIQELLDVGRYEDANKVARQMYDSDRSYELAKNIFAITSIYVGDFDGGEKLLANASGTIAVDESLADAYKSQNQQYRLIGILKKNIDIDGEDVSSIVALANLYVEQGDKYTAINILKSLATTKPELKTQIDEYIKSITK